MTQLALFLPDPSAWSLHVWPSGRGEVRRWEYDEQLGWVSHIGAWGESVEAAREMAKRRGIEVAL